MARGRIITKDASVDPELNSISLDAMLLYLLTVPHLDRDGLIDGTPMRLAALAAPLQPAIRDRAGACINEWIDAGLVIRYGSPQRPILFFHGFRKHQVDLNYASEPPSRYPPPPGWKTSKDGLIPDDPELCFRLADGFHARSAYRRALLAAAGSDAVIEAGDDYLTNGIPNSSRTVPDNTPNSSRIIKSNQIDHAVAVDQSLSDLTLGYGNGGGVGGDGLADLPIETLVVIAYNVGSLFNFPTEWTNYQRYLLALEQADLIRLIRWIFYYSVKDIYTLSAIHSMPGVIKAHMNKNESPALATRQEAELGMLVQKAMTTNEIERPSDEVDL